MNIGLRCFHCGKGYTVELENPPNFSCKQNVLVFACLAIFFQLIDIFKGM